MRKITLLYIAFAFSSLQAYSQTVQQGKVVLQNSNHAPLSGVQITAFGAQPADSDNEGKFRLNFSKASPGDLVPVREIYKKNYELVNEAELKEWILSDKKDLLVMMCPAGKIQENKEKYYQIGFNNYEKQYNQTIKELERQKEQSKLTEQQYWEQIKERYDEYNATVKQLEKYADVFARINRDDLNELEQRAFLLIDEGKLDEAIRLYEEEKLLQKLGQQLELKEILEDEIEDFIPSLQRYVEILIFASGSENLNKADEILKLIAMATPKNFENQVAYSVFLKERVDYIKAVEWAEKALQVAQTQADIAKIHLELGELYNIQNDFEKSQTYLNSGSKIYLSLAKKVSPAFYTNYVYATYQRAYLQYQLAHSYFDIPMIDEAIKLCRQGLKAQENEIDNKSTDYLYNRFLLLDCLAISKQLKGAFKMKSKEDLAKVDTEVEELYKETLEIIAKLSEKDFYKYANVYSLLLNNTANFYWQTKEYEKAARYLLQSKDIQTKLMEKDVMAAKNGLSIIYGSLGNTYVELGKFDLAEEYYTKRILLGEELAEMNPYAFYPKLAESYLGTAIFYEKTQQYDRGLQYALRSLEIYDKIGSDAEQYSVLKRAVVLKLVDLYEAKDDYENAMTYAQYLIILTESQERGMLESVAHEELLLAAYLNAFMISMHREDSMFGLHKNRMLKYFTHEELCSYLLEQSINYQETKPAKTYQYWVRAFELFEDFPNYKSKNCSDFFDVFTNIAIQLFMADDVYFEQSFHILDFVVENCNDVGLIETIGSFYDLLLEE